MQTTSNPNALTSLKHIPVKNEHFKSFFKPINVKAFEALLYEYTMLKRSIEKFYDDFQATRNAIALGYLIKSHKAKNNRNVDYKPDLNVAISMLDADYWKKALDEIDLFEQLPAEEKDKWDAHIDNLTCPRFEEETVIATIQTLLSEREEFLIKRVAGIFRNLSPNHVTNCKNQFRKRIIFSSTKTNIEYLHDFRKVIAELNGELFNSYYFDTENLLDVALANHRGKWRYADGNKFKFRTYLKGTTHIELSPRLSLVMNEILALHYGLSLSNDIRENTKKAELDWKPLPKSYVSVPHNVCCSLRKFILNEVRRTNGRYEIPYLWNSDYKMNRDALDTVLRAAGGISESAGTRYTFALDPRWILDEISTSGFVPSKVAAQFYPTPDPIAKRIHELAAPKKGESLLEPSVGTGSLLKPFLHQGLSITAVDREALYADYIEEVVGGTVIEQDFLECAKFISDQDLVVMNPPFKGNQAIKHVTEAKKCLTKNGRLLAVVPNSAKKHLTGITYEEDIDESLFHVSVKMSIIIITI